jgi:N-acetyl-D-muramate 6-phosphate phosphatase
MALTKPRAILFDLDGTLADTAPDLADAVNSLRMARGLAPTPYALLRPFASAGARGLIGAAFQLQPADAGYEELRVAFLDHYEENIARKSHLFEGINALLDNLGETGIAWGIVTNKAARFTEALVPKIGLHHAGCVISGDTTSHSKPHPAPLLEAARRLGMEAADCWYVGDDLRDIQAGQAAGMATIAAAWGYCGAIGLDAWGADAIMATPLDLLPFIHNNPSISLPL